MKITMENQGRRDAAIVLFGLVVVTIWAAPVIFTSGQTGVYDWDTGMQGFEALRISILKYHQWPGVNPWIGGGQPLISNPGLSILSLEGLSVLIFGTAWGLRLGLLFYMFIGFLGAWALSGMFWRERLLRLAFALYVTANAAAAYHVAVGHLVFQNIWCMPWLFYYVLRVKEDKWAGLKAGIVYGMAFVSSPMYIVQYAALISAGLFAWLWLQSGKLHHRAFVNWILLCVTVAGTLVCYRLVTILFTARDFARISGWQAHFDLPTTLRFYFYPYDSLAIVSIINEFWLGPWEVSCYVGWVSVALALVSLKGGPRWWHVMSALLVWAMIGNDSRYYLMYWIQQLPSFDSHQTFMRIRMFIPLFVGIAAVQGLSYLWCSWGTRRSQWCAALLLGGLMVGEVLVVSHRILSLSHVPLVVVGESAGESNPEAAFRNISVLPRPKDAPPTVVTSYAATRMNLGWVRGSDSYIPAATIRVGMDDQGYRGEYLQDGKVVKPVYWSPNRLRFENLAVGVPLWINANPGSPWYGNGVQLFPQYRIVERTKPFEVMPNELGVVDLSYRYPGQTVGVFGAAGFLLLAIAAVAATRKNNHHLAATAAVQ